ncbi:MAG: hypothetical protein IPP91_00005 [Betaproteobacteria bacterium]|nr:hypothetical protein [Betaproteobacteria bacterium]
MHTDPPELEGMLAALGYESFSPTEVRAAAIDSATLAGPDVDCPRIEEWFDMVGDLRGSPIAHRSAPSRDWPRCRSEMRPVALLEAGVPIATGPPSSRTGTWGSSTW